ncbi:uncharacterized protein LY89DRAFT_612048 [Mollisia scopiformis]|uniref:Guanine nucleotide-exchange factor SEC12 n=1 Tax=Mollisia scopiformis TaxID=149040 RepID=A0A194XIR9_MOLSC|nr:uncharacterized protein LY89DRAFT_612048 [Mollisia scopiformis]KUJ20014.1 hypothetical protein LY89DRAFT_612048 [Mollisia scopiformis]
MAPLVPSAKLTLSYPLYACDFDPLDSARLVVGGGGGAGRTGVGNRITVIDVANANELKESAEVELSKEEDNVTSLAVGAEGRVFAGVNGRPGDVGRGVNAHFRVLGVEGKKGKEEEGGVKVSIKEQSRSSLFQGREKDVYQRITRLSKPFPNKPQLGAVATGLAKNSEIVLFDTSKTAPPVSRGAVTSAKEAEDVDFIQTGDDEYIFAYCDEHDVYIKKISSEDDEEAPECIYITPGTRGKDKPTTPKFRAMRFLSKEFLIMLTNIHSNGGVVLQIFRIPPSGKGQCRLAQSVRLPDRITKATGMAVCNLTPPTTPSEPQGYTQFVIAVAGHDISLNLFKVDFQAAAGISIVSSIKPFRSFRNVHPLQITSLAFSNFTPPAHPITAHTPPQYLKLASVGVANTVVVHTFPLFPVPLSMKRGQSTTPRYVIALPSTALAFAMGLLMSVLGIALAAVFIQSFLEIRGVVPEYLEAKNYVPMKWQHKLHRPFDYNQLEPKVLPSSTETLLPYSTVTGAGGATPTPKGTQCKAKQEAKVTKTPQQKGQDDMERMIAEDKLVRNLRDAGKWKQIPDEVQEKHNERTWDQLGTEEKKKWKQALKEAGNWAEDLPEEIFKGVMFGEMGGAVGRAVAGA